MPTLTVPAPTYTDTTVRIEGAGFADAKTRLALDGVGKTTNIFRPAPDGTFRVGIHVAGSPRTQVLKAEQYVGGKWSAAAQTSLSVVDEPSTPPPPPPPPPPPTGDPAFLGRPASGPINRSGPGAVVISDVAINGGTRDNVAGIGITIRGARDVTITDVDLANLVGGIYLYDCSGKLVIRNVRSRNIGDGTIGAGHSNHIQFAECTFDGAVSGCRFQGGRTEDMLSIWHSGGAGAGHELVVEDCAFEGFAADTATARAWTSGSGTGTILSDGAGSSKNGYVIVRRNTYLTPGQVCIQHIDGPGLQTYDNVILAEKHPRNNNPITSWEGNPRGVIHDNRYYMTKADGSHPDPWMHQNPSGMVLTNNVEDPAIDRSKLVIVL